MNSTDYFNTLIEIAEDSNVDVGTIPSIKSDKKTAANLQFEMLQNQPYRFTSDDVLFSIALRKEIPQEELTSQRELFFSKGRPCFRALPLTKSYGWGIHSKEEGKIAMYGVDSDEYQGLVADESVKKKKAMRSKRG